VTDVHVRAAIVNRFNYLDMRSRSGLGKLR